MKLFLFSLIIYYTFNDVVSSSLTSPWGCARCTIPLNYAHGRISLGERLSILKIDHAMFITKLHPLTN